MSHVADLRMQHGDHWPDPFDLITLPAVTALDESPTHGDETVAPVTGRPELALPAPLDVNAADDADNGSDEVSIIGSEDGSQHVQRDEQPAEPGDEEELDMMLTFESMLDDVGNLRDPVVDVWYDLDEITSIPDPIHFLEDVKRLNMYVLRYIHQMSSACD